MVKKAFTTSENSILQYRDSLLSEKGESAGFILTEDRVIKTDVISSGLYPLDSALGIGGIPRGKIVEIYGPEAAGKTSLALQFVAQCQKGGGFAHYIDAEHALDPTNLAAFGANESQMILSQPNNGEEAFELVEFAAEKAVPLVVVDSVAALVPEAELEAEMEQQFMGIHARLVTRGMHKITAKANQGRTTIIFINQIRMKPTSYGNPETTTGGHALRHATSIRIDVRKGELFPNRDEPVGQMCEFKIAKNKLAPPFRTASVPLIYGQGFDSIRCTIEAAIAKGIITKGGAWLTYEEIKWQGFEAARKAMIEDPTMLSIICEKVGMNK